MLGQAIIDVTEHHDDGFYVVAVAKSDAGDCLGQDPLLLAQSGGAKEVRVVVKEMMSEGVSNGSIAVLGKIHTFQTFYHVSLALFMPKVAAPVFTQAGKQVIKDLDKLNEF